MPARMRRERARCMLPSINFAVGWQYIQALNSPEDPLSCY